MQTKKRCRSHCKFGEFSNGSMIDAGYYFFTAFFIDYLRNAFIILWSRDCYPGSMHEFLLPFKQTHKVNLKKASRLFFWSGGLSVELYLNNTSFDEKYFNTCYGKKRF